MKICVASYSFHGMVSEGTMDVFRYLEACRYRYQLRAADIWNGMFPTMDDAFIKKVRQSLDEHELELANLCVDGAHIWEDDPAVREKHYQNALANLKAGEMLGARTIRIDAGVREKTWTSEQFDWIVKRYKEYAQRAADNGYRVGPENHWGAENEPPNMKKLCEAVNHPAFGVLLHYKNTDEAAFAKWAMHTHISWDVTQNSLEPSMSMLRKAGYKDYWSIEHHSGKNELTEVAVQVTKIRDLLSRW